MIKVPADEAYLNQLEMGHTMEWGSSRNNQLPGCLGGSMVEHLPLVRAWSWSPDSKSHIGLPLEEPASLSACVSASLFLCVSHE